MGRFITLTGNIDEQTAALVIGHLRRLDLESRQMQLTGLYPEPFRICLIISSYGGELMPGFAIVDAIQALKTPVHVHVDGYACSAAILLLIVGAKRSMGRNAMVLIHQLSSGAYGTFESLKEHQVLLDKLMLKMRNLYTQYTSMTPDDVDVALKKDTWLDADECLAKGIVDSIA